MVHDHLAGLLLSHDNANVAILNVLQVGDVAGAALLPLLVAEAVELAVTVAREENDQRNNKHGDEPSKHSSSFIIYSVMLDAAYEEPRARECRS